MFSGDPHEIEQARVSSRRVPRVQLPDRTESGRIRYKITRRLSSSGRGPWEPRGSPWPLLGYHCLLPDRSGPCHDKQHGPVHCTRVREWAAPACVDGMCVVIVAHAFHQPGGVDVEPNAEPRGVRGHLCERASQPVLHELSSAWEMRMHESRIVRGRARLGSIYLK